MLPPAAPRIDEAIQLLISSVEAENGLSPVPSGPMGRDECDQMADRVRLSLQSFEARAHTILSGLIQTRNALTPINNLPTEIIIRIWALAARDSAEGGHDMLWTLARVCKWWRDKVLAHSELWGEGISTHFSEHRIAWAIQKSGGRNIHVFAHNGAINQHQDRFDQVLPHADRWESLALNLARHSDSVYTLKILNLPKLARLELSRWGNRVFNSPVEPPRAPNLRAIQITGVPLEWDAMAFPRLRSIHLGRIARMGPSHDQLFQLISLTPELEELVLEKVTFQASEEPMYDAEPETSSHPYISAPNLQTLRLREMETVDTAWIICSLRPTRYRLVLVDFLPTSVLRTHLSHLRSCLAGTFSYGAGLTLEVSYQVISIHTPGTPDQPGDPLDGTQGLELQFGSLNPAEDLELVSSFFAEHHIPLTIEITPAATQFQDHLPSLQLHRLSSLRTLRIAHPINPNSLLRVLERPWGPRTNLWWPCPLLSTIEIGSHAYTPGPEPVDLEAFGIAAFLQGRWGYPPPPDFTRGQVRPAQLSRFVHKSDIVDRLTRREDGLLQHATVSFGVFRPAKPVKRREEPVQSD
ncbi:hypothetical protein FRC04_002043 [Tulasnella sp. 424]|nr:hypothetical protein FRC04_002043 [Tulasnella sp. 424]KAG8968249.1 hypothetical protein FRC05_001630 [Tulasnella sp. 425]